MTSSDDKSFLKEKSRNVARVAALDANMDRMGCDICRRKNDKCHNEV